MRQKYIDEAIRSAERSSLKIANHGAVVIHRGKVVGRGHNKYCVENVNSINQFSIHAEVDAINNALRKISQEDLKKCILIVVRKMKKDNDKNFLCQHIGLSAPCKHCTNFINKCGIKACYYS